MQIGLFSEASDASESISKPTGPFKAWTDGSCLGNPGKGGWGVVLTCATTGQVLKELSGGHAHTTNNRMEMQAVIEALKQTLPGSTVEILTDSKYVQQGLSTWLAGWKKKGWKTAGGDPVKNVELWKDLDALNTSRKVTLTWVRGHNGEPGNERADLLATTAAAQA